MKKSVFAAALAFILAVLGFAVAIPASAATSPNREVVLKDDGVVYVVNWREGEGVKVTIYGPSKEEFIIRDDGNDGKVDWTNLPSSSYEGERAQQIFDRATSKAKAISPDEAAAMAKELLGQWKPTEGQEGAALDFQDGGMSFRIIYSGAGLTQEVPFFWVWAQPVGGPYASWEQMLDQNCDGLMDQNVAPKPARQFLATGQAAYTDALRAALRYLGQQLKS